MSPRTSAASALESRPRAPLHRAPLALLGLFALSAGALAAACSASGDATKFDGAGAGSGSGAAGAGGSSSSSSGAGGFNVGTGGGGGGGGVVKDPATCAEAAASKTYVGCDFWPTVTANSVWSIFDFAFVAANAGDQTATVTVTRGMKELAKVDIAPNALATIPLPWVPELKGPVADQCLQPTGSATSARVDGGAYHVVSTRPITAYQFNPLQYASVGGAPGKDWTKCPAASCPFPTDCTKTYYTYSNDASLLLPSTAMTGNYRVVGRHGYQAGPFTSFPEFMTITGTADGTSVTVYVSPTGTIEAGAGVVAVPKSGSTTLMLNAGDVVELMTYTSLTGNGELSGSVIQADKPVQVIAGTACSLVPDDKVACDHTEESVLPAETFGKHYFVTPPTGPNGDTPGHVVRIYGNFDGTKLTYPSGTPAGAPGTLNAGQWVDLGVVQQSFEVEADQAFAVASFQLGGELVDPNTPELDRRGDPSMSLMTAVEQYRVKYVFLAPLDYDVSYVDIAMPLDAKVTIDGATLGETPSAIGAVYGVARHLLGPGQGGAHVLTATKPVGLQVSGYGKYTSYQYPGGMNLKVIAPPPPIPK